ncbi:MAG: hypothetical protein KC635_23690 [Myxococcales bacterium]|nr:hypothetical protein [Myxococcales bacterium]MCB9737114.1 hypothetical protein [Deltaproteobacteria bacterium]
MGHIASRSSLGRVDGGRAARNAPCTRTAARRPPPEALITALVTFLDRHFWIVVLAGLALAASQVAGIVNDAIAAEWLTAAPAPPPEVLAAAAAPADLGGRVPADVDASRVLLARRVFNLDPPKPPARPEPKAPEPVAEAEPDGAELAETELPVDLVGTMVREAGALAVLRLEGRVKLARVGMTILSGRATVVDIDPRWVVLEENGKHTVLGLWGEKRTKPAPPVVRAPPRAARSRTSAARRRSIYRAVHRKGGRRYEVDAQAFQQAIGGAQQLAAELRTVPATSEGRVTGIRVTSARVGGAFRALGLRSGDVIERVNGRAATGTWAISTLQQRALGTGQTTVEVSRRGRPVTLTWTMK